jgi:tRNA nucleotidyltransferase (CCA-adding enzyme)
VKTYRVGGAVRDSLLGVPFDETDWVVIGASVEQMISAGFQQVGRDFPVFLHPETHEEYALARTERKTGPGYRGFTVHAEPSVTLEEDLLRRDLTINAMAMDDNGQLIDPYGGLADLQARVLRHVSPSFTEDPLRILRVARFAARYAALGFSIAPDTLQLMTQLANSGELAHISVERLWVEIEKGLATEQPGLFFETLARCDALTSLIPDLPAEQAIHRVTVAAGQTERNDCRWAALLSPLAPEGVQTICDALRTPKAWAQLALSVSRLDGCFASALDASEIIEVLEKLDALRREEPFAGFCETLRALDDAYQHPLQQLEQGRLIAQSIRARDLPETAPGPELGATLRKARLSALTLWLNEHSEKLPE